MDKNNDCERIKMDIEKLFGSIGGCLDATFDANKSKMDVTKGVFGIGKNLFKVGWDATSCVVKHTPKAIVTVANAKRELIDTIQEEYGKHQKQRQEDVLDEKIKRLSNTTPISRF